MTHSSNKKYDLYRHIREQLNHNNYKMRDIESGYKNGLVCKGTTLKMKPSFYLLVIVKIFSSSVIYFFIFNKRMFGTYTRFC